MIRQGLFAVVVTVLVRVQVADNLLAEVPSSVGAGVSSTYQQQQLADGHLLAGMGCVLTLKYCARWVARRRALIASLRLLDCDCLVASVGSAVCVVGECECPAWSNRL